MASRPLCGLPGGQSPHPPDDALERQEIRISVPSRLFERRQAVRQDGKVGLGIEGKPCLVIAHEEAVLVQLESEFLPFESAAIKVAEDGKQDLVLLENSRLGDRRVPVDVEVSGVRRAGTVFEHVHPPGIVGAGRHVVGHDVQKQSHAVTVEPFDQLLEFPLRPQLGVDAQGVRNVVAVGASAPGPETRRSVKVADAQLVEIGHQLASVHKTKIQAELDSVSRRRHSKRAHGFCSPSAARARTTKARGAS
jgi:hypothetical protein